MYMHFVWLGLMVFFILLETYTVSMTSVWFAAGALVALAVSLLGLPVWLQLVVFLVVSGVLLGLLRPLVKKHFTPKVTATNVDSIIGSTGVVTAAIDNVMAVGTVKLGAMEWTARSTENQTIPAGTLVQVDKIEGVKVFVSPAQVTASL